MMFSVCENTNLKVKNDEFGDMEVVHSSPTDTPWDVLKRSGFSRCEFTAQTIFSRT